MASSHKSLLCISALFAALCCVSTAWAADAPSDPCTLLAAADVSRIAGKAYSAAQSSPAPRPFANTNAGTDCNYAPKGSGDQLLFRVYFDNSPAQSADLHSRLKLFFSPATPVDGVGDEAYFDPKHAIHVRKGNVRYYLQLGKDASAEKPVKELGALVAGRL